MQRIGYYTFRGAVWMFSLIPFWLMYRLADIVYFFLYYVVPYRKEVVMTNLKNSFPEKIEAERIRIAKASYRNMADILLETIKGFSISKAEVKKRFVFTNPELINNLTEHNGSVIFMTAHYANWEWCALSFSLFMDAKIVGIYKPLSNKFIDQYVLGERTKFGIELMDMNRIKWAFKKAILPKCGFTFVSDQTTSSKQTHWLKFLHQDTACPRGADKYAHLTNLPVYFLDMDRVKRGYYTVRFELLCQKPSEVPEGAITKIFMDRLEQKLIKKPDNWLWSHKRWKLKKEEGVGLWIN